MTVEKGNVVPNVIFRPVSAYPDLAPATELQGLHDIVSTEPRMPTVMHMYDSC